MAVQSSGICRSQVIRKLWAILLALCILSVSAGTTAETVKLDVEGMPASWAEELQEGSWLNVSPEKLAQPSVSGAEMMELLDRLVAEEAPEKAAEWAGKYQQLRDYEQPLKRFDAMGMLYLACLQIGGEYGYSLEDPVMEALAILQAFPFDGYFFSDGLFQGIDGPKYSLPVYGDVVYLDFSSLYYNVLAPSPVSGEYPFPYDAARNSIGEWEQPTYLDAVLAVIRAKLRKGHLQSGWSLAPEPLETYSAESPEMLALELEHAGEYGLPLDQLDAPEITGREMMALLDVVVVFQEPKWLAEEWFGLYPRLREWDKPLTRFDAMAMTYLAARFMGTGWEVLDIPSQLDAFARLDRSFDDESLSDGLFDGLDDPVYPVPDHGDNCPLDLAAFYWNLYRTSLVSGEFPFSVDWNEMSVHTDRMCSYQEGVLAAVRMYESSPAALQRLKSEWVSRGDWEHYDVSMIEESMLLTDAKEAEILRTAEKRREEILNSPTQIVHSDTFIPGETYTGTAYYVSENGDDSNDGLTPETAWRTVHKISYEVGGQSAEMWRDLDSLPEYVTIGDGCIQPGDAVFFERGGTYRLNDLNLAIPRSGITFSAYGEGPKPIISGSPENGSGEGRWSLYYADDSGVKIWQYHRDMKQVSQIILDGRICATRVYEWWTDNGWRSLDLIHSVYLDTRNTDSGIYVLRDELLSPVESLTENHTLLSRADFTEYQYPIIQQGQPGPLYLRCDEGNPGELFESVEFVWAGDFLGNLICCYADDTVLDNLNVRYFGTYAVSADDSYMHTDFTERGTVIQNCEFAYGGGQMNYSGPVPDSYGGGDCVYGFVCDTTVQNCYFHDMSAVAVGYETHDREGRLTGYHHIRNNLLERCLTGIRINPFSAEGQYLDSVRIEGNMTLWSGEICPEFDGGRVAFIYTDNHFGESIIRDNIFYLCEEILMEAYNTGAGPDWSMPEYSSNVIVQYADRPLIELFSSDVVSGMWNWFPVDTDITDKINRLFDETGAEVYFKLR